MAEVADLSDFNYFVLRNAVSYSRLLINSCQVISGCVRVDCLDGLAEGFPWIEKSISSVKRMTRCSETGLGFIIVPVGLNAPLEFLRGD